MGVLWDKMGEGVVRYWPLMNSFFLVEVFTSVPILVKIDYEMRPWECSQTDRQTDTLTDANQFYNLSHAICYRHGTDNEEFRRERVELTYLTNSWAEYIEEGRPRGYAYSYCYLLTAVWISNKMSTTWLQLRFCQDLVWLYCNHGC